MEPRTCRFRTLANGPAATLQQCLDCGTLSLHVGPMTMRLDASTMEALWATVSEGLQVLHASQLAQLTATIGQA